MNKYIEVVADKQSLIDRSVALVIEKIQQSIEERGKCTIALSGGNTPKPLYAKLALQSLPWEKIHVFWGDERYVSPDNPDSNQKMARETWLNLIPIPASNIHAMPTAGNNPALDADKYEGEIQQFFALTPGEFPHFDIMLLGMGSDGHTASLFPHTQALTVEDKLVTVGAKDGQPRLTLTVSTINCSRYVIFLVAGADKQLALSQIFAEEASSTAYPSRLIQPQGELWWLLDREAGAILEKK